MAADDLMETVNASFGTTGKRVDVAAAASRDQMRDKITTS
jgi:hypothetical protein